MIGFSAFLLVEKLHVDLLQMYLHSNRAKISLDMVDTFKSTKQAKFVLLIFLTLTSCQSVWFMYIFGILRNRMWLQAALYIGSRYQLGKKRITLLDSSITLLRKNRHSISLRSLFTGINSSILTLTCLRQSGSKNGKKSMFFRVL